MKASSAWSVEEERVRRTLSSSAGRTHHTTRDTRTMLSSLSAWHLFCDRLKFPRAAGSAGPEDRLKGGRAQRLQHEPPVPFPALHVADAELPVPDVRGDDRVGRALGVRAVAGPGV